jgi:catechol 2,3-dioxygenase-like lactoylglutathione lyase family enzyme
MFAHVTIRAGDRPESERFYRCVLPTLGVEPTHERENLVAWDDFAMLAAQTESAVTRHLHVGFVAPSRAHVDAFWQAGIDAGYPDAGRPGERAQYRPDYYGAFLLDPDGNSIEAVHHGDTRRGGHIDHLWIGVADLDDAERFYATIARHTGLRPGPRRDERVRFSGAWATFSLVADGRPPTEHLHIAFPAPDRTTVDEFHRAATAAGYRDNGAPGERPQYGAGYYSAYVLDPDGTNVESVTRAPR